MKIQPILKVVLAIMLFLCLAPMPYGYFMLVRVVATTLFCYFAYCEFREERDGLGILYIGLIILFQPFEKIALGSPLWNAVDVIVGIWLLVSALLPSLAQKE